MLVKLGDIWVDPTKVVLLEPYAIHAGMKSSETSLVNIVTEKHASSTTGGIDTFAAIINNSVGQSYGGEVEETPKAV
jgi:hypothetical protein